MKKLAIVALVCINVALLALVLDSATSRADAQTYWGPNNYLLMSAQVEKDYDVIYVVDLAQERMLSFRFDRTSKKLVPYQGVDLAKDFR